MGGSILDTLFGYSFFRPELSFFCRCRIRSGGIPKSWKHCFSAHIENRPKRAIFRYAEHALEMPWVWTMLHDALRTLHLTKNLFSPKGCFTAAKLVYADPEALQGPEALPGQGHTQTSTQGTVTRQGRTNVGRALVQKGPVAQRIFTSPRWATQPYE